MCTQYVGSTQQVCGEYTVHDAGLNNPRFMYSLRKHKYPHNTVESFRNIRIILSYGSFTSTICYAITTVITIRFKNGVCTNFYRPQTKFGKVMFLHLSVSHSVHGGGCVCIQGGSASRDGLHPGGVGQIPPQCILFMMLTLLISLCI